MYSLYFHTNSVTGITNLLCFNYILPSMNKTWGVMWHEWLQICMWSRRATKWDIRM